MPWDLSSRQIPERREMDNKGMGVIEWIIVFVVIAGIATIILF